MERIPSLGQRILNQARSADITGVMWEGPRTVVLMALRTLVLFQPKPLNLSPLLSPPHTGLLGQVAVPCVQCAQRADV